ncbi:tetratricopeptide repeat-containing sulfotransferase family protein [Pseudoxanthomonas sp. JBR18]|uniref:tetratricopeptide repeat-containing sulfotransferase family protein n=1 Tax=Pseudoxanthomonas sp. JBR18 TaxID=2969308 RepID=UPI002305434C|nr:tetratricopeptide repeat-containing sulfotransferase family protein [Pseudoxanthomonas sp. JBR18]WCE03295.1 sulfotransferase [Pseudoxanthomonas sp. JBR18]
MNQADRRSEMQLRAQYGAAIEALNQRDWNRARQIADAIVLQAPRHGGVHFVCGIAALEMGDMRAAFRHMSAAVQLSPARSDYAAQLARVLLECHLQREAIEQADRAMSLGPDDPLTLNTLAVVYTRANAHGQAVQAFERAVQRLPGQASLHFNLATSLTANGDLTRAVEACETCIGLDPHFWKAHLTLAQLSKQTPASNHIPRLESLLAGNDVRPDAALYLHLALEKEYDDLGDYERALGHLIAGKRAWQGQLDRSGDSDAAIFDAIIETCSAVPAPEAGHRTDEPIFIFGMPRTGTTLVERIVSSHSQVHAAGELQVFPLSFKRATGSRTPWPLDRSTVFASAHLNWQALGASYLAGTRPLTGHTPRFIDKLPHNFLYAGWIARAMPNAKMICLRRDPMDSCIANFRQLFALTSPVYNYSFDLLETGRYWLLFDRLMHHFQQVMPGRILEVHYEDVVDDQEGQTRRLLEHCGLPWEDACLQFEKNTAPVSTASAVQVRSKIYRSSLQRWKRYGPMVDELRDLLAQGGAPVGE